MNRFKLKLPIDPAYVSVYQQLGRLTFLTFSFCCSFVGFSENLRKFSHFASIDSIIFLSGIISALIFIYPIYILLGELFDIKEKKYIKRIRIDYLLAFFITFLLLHTGWWWGISSIFILTIYFTFSYLLRKKISQGLIRAIQSKKNSQRLKYIDGDKRVILADSALMEQVDSLFFVAIFLLAQLGFWVGGSASLLLGCFIFIMWKLLNFQIRNNKNLWPLQVVRSFYSFYIGGLRNIVTPVTILLICEDWMLLIGIILIISASVLFYLGAYKVFREIFQIFYPQELQEKEEKRNFYEKFFYFFLILNLPPIFMYFFSEIAWMEFFGILTFFLSALSLFFYWQVKWFALSKKQMV